MEKPKLRMTLEEIRWILHAIEVTHKDYEMVYEKACLWDLYNRVKKVEGGSALFDWEVDTIYSELLDIVNKHPDLLAAYRVMLSHQMISIIDRGLTCLSVLERTRPLNEAELRRRKVAEEARQSCLSDINKYFREPGGTGRPGGQTPWEESTE